MYEVHCDAFGYLQESIPTHLLHPCLSRFVCRSNVTNVECPPKKSIMSNPARRAMIGLKLFLFGIGRALNKSYSAKGVLGT